MKILCPVSRRLYVFPSPAVDNNCDAKVTKPLNVLVALPLALFPTPPHAGLRNILENSPNLSIEILNNSVGFRARKNNSHNIQRIKLCLSGSSYTSFFNAKKIAIWKNTNFPSPVKSRNLDLVLLTQSVKGNSWQFSYIANLATRKTRGLFDWAQR